MQSFDQHSLRGFRRQTVHPYLATPDSGGEPGRMKAPLSQYPGMNPFVLDWLAGDERFLPRASHWAVGLARSSQLAAGREDLAAALDASNRHWGIFAEDAITRWAGGET